LSHPTSGSGDETRDHIITILIFWEKSWVFELPDGEWDDVDEAVDLECADEEETEMFEHLGKEIPGKKFSQLMLLTGVKPF